MSRTPIIPKHIDLDLEAGVLSVDGEPVANCIAREPITTVHDVAGLDSITITLLADHVTVTRGSQHSADSDSTETEPGMTITTIGRTA